MSFGDTFDVYHSFAQVVVINSLKHKMYSANVPYISIAANFASLSR